METTLRAGLAALGLGTEAAPQLLDYASRMLEKNRVMNLTAITAPQEVAQLHLLDCAALLNHCSLSGRRVVDVGTGAGFPGMVLKILVPDCEMTLLDSLGKRIRWLTETCAEMGLRGVECVHARAEEFAAEYREQFQVATSRAVASLPLLCELALPLVAVGGVFVAMKSVDCDAELNAAQDIIHKLGGRVEKVVDYTIPHTEVTHRLVIIEKVRPTPPQFPRPWAKIKKASLF